MEEVYREIKEENFQALLGMQTECEILNIGLCNKSPRGPLPLPLSIGHHIRFLAVAMKPAFVFAMRSGGFHLCY
jgi:hypothetical protein